MSSVIIDLPPVRSYIKDIEALLRETETYIHTIQKKLQELHSFWNDDIYNATHIVVTQIQRKARELTYELDRQKKYIEEYARLTDAYRTNHRRIQ